MRVLASGLTNPRGVAVGTDGRVYVAEAGTGEAGTGRVIEVRHGDVRALVTGLPSAVSPEGEVTGPTNVTVFHRRLTAVIGAGPRALDGRFTTLRRLRPGSDRTLGDIAAFVDAHPDTTDVDQPPNPTDSNPYGVARVDETHYLVADAANNTLLMVGPAGSVRRVAKFPNEIVSTAHLPFPFPAPAIPAEAVPTTVAIGPDGYAYVGELKGFPFTPGSSRVWRVAPWANDVMCDPGATSGPCTVFLGGMTSVTGLDFGPDGSLYVLSIVKAGVFSLFSGGDTTGALYRVKNGVTTELAPGQLPVAGDVAVGRDGTAYVTVDSTSSGGGRLVAVRPRRHDG